MVYNMGTGGESLHPKPRTMTFTALQIAIAFEFKAISKVMQQAEHYGDWKAQDILLSRYNSLACADLIPCHWSEIVGW